MDVIAPVTDYVQGSILTTLGDIIKRGASDAERLAIGTALYALRANAAGNDLEYGHPGKIIADSIQQHDGGAASFGTSQTQLAQITTPSLPVDALFIASFLFEGTKSTNGHAVLEMRQKTNGGTGVFYWMGQDSTWTICDYVYNGQYWYKGASMVGVFTNAGTAVVEAVGYCDAGTMSVTGNSRLSIVVLGQ